MRTYMQDVWPLTDKYRENISHWEGRYKLRVPVYSGEDCLEYVTQVDACPDADCAGLLQVQICVYVCVFCDFVADVVVVVAVCVCVCVCVIV